MVKRNQIHCALLHITFKALHYELSNPLRSTVKSLLERHTHHFYKEETTYKTLALAVILWIREGGYEET